MRLASGPAVIAAMLLASAAIAGPARFDWFDYRGGDAIDLTARPGPGEYRNPILQGFYPDPSVTRVGDDFYLVNSTFSYFPGLPIFHSRDLVSWTQIGNAIDRPGMIDLKRLELSRGLFAPDISHHGGLFYIANTCVDCGGNFVITARDPAGPWSDPVWNKVGGIDPSLFFDEDGSAWLVNNDAPPGKPRYDGHRAIWIQRFDTKTLQPFGPRTMLVDGGVHPEQNPIWPEGPHIFRKDGYYYLTAAEGGTAEGHTQTIYRSRRPDGPYEPGPTNPILTQKGLDPARTMPITSAGHADLIETASGEWWATFLATRPYRGDFYNIGRETFLLRVTWQDGWPRIALPGQAIPYVAVRPALPPQPAPAAPTNSAFHVRDAFGGTALGREWLRIRDDRGAWQRVEGGALRLDPPPVALGDDGHPAFVGRRLQHHDATIETQLRFVPAHDGDRAGLAIVQNQSHFYAVSLAQDGGRRAVRLERRASAGEPQDGVAIATRPFAGDVVRFRIAMRGDRLDVFYADARGAWRPLATGLDATILSTRTAGGFIGTTVGPFARSGG